MKLAISVLLLCMLTAGAHSVRAADLEALRRISPPTTCIGDWTFVGRTTNMWVVAVYTGLPSNGYSIFAMPYNHLCLQTLKHIVSTGELIYRYDPEAQEFHERRGTGHVIGCVDSSNTRGIIIVNERKDNIFEFNIGSGVWLATIKIAVNDN